MVDLLSRSDLVAAARLLRCSPLGLGSSLALAGGGWLWLRDSSLVAVRDVQITRRHRVRRRSRSSAALDERGARR